MKRNILICLFASIIFIFNSGNSFAQIHENGTPSSFTPAFGTNANIAIPFAEMPIVNVDSLIKEDLINDQYKEIPWRFGYNHYVNLNPENSGQWTTTVLDNGDLEHVWMLGIHCPDAQTINIAFDKFIMPKGGKMFIYNADRTMVLGAFTDKTNQQDHQLGVDLVRGSKIIIEYDESPDVPVGQSLSYNSGINIFRVTHGYRSLFQHLMKSFGSSESCENNIICDPNWQKQKRAVACITVNGNGVCSGSLINDVPSDGTPYFLTANHCGTANDAPTWVFRFNWESPTCTPSNDGPYGYTISGATQKAFNGHSDFNLVQLSSTPPDTFNLYYEGWSNIWVYADSTTGIHHPAGDIKKISFAAAPTHDAGMQNEGNGAADVWRVGQWTNGVTEGGSSGSPLYDQNHRVIGQLYGGPSDCSVTTIDRYDVYGKFATSWAYGSTAGTRLKDWLDPNNTGALVNDGYDPNVTPPALDAGILNINTPVQTNYCNNTITPSVVLKNHGSTTLTSVNINYQLDGGPVVTHPWSGSLLLHAMATVTLTTMSSIPSGSHFLKVYTSSPNSGTDLDHSNDTATVVFVTQLNNFPITEGFEHAVFPYQTWRIGNPDGNDTWFHNIAVGGFGNSTSCAEYDNNTNNQYQGQYDTIYSPTIDFSNAISPIRLSFSIAYQQAASNINDSLLVSASTDCGATWSNIYAKGGATLATVNGFLTSPFTPSSGQWRKDSITINSLVGHSNVMFAFANYNAGGNNIYLDDINISVGNTGGIASSDNPTMFNLYPNPSNGILNVSVNLNRVDNVSLHVTNLLGQEICSKNIGNTSGGNYTLDLSNAAKGIYFVQLKTDKETTVKRITIE